MPQGWGMPFFSSLIYTGTRVGGQRERQTQAFEAGSTYFPRDFPATEAYDEYTEDRADAEREIWERKPPAKRPNYDKLGTRSPWRPDWRVVLGIEERPEPQELEDFVDTQRMVVDATAPAPGATNAGDKKPEPWLLLGSDVPAIITAISSMPNPATGLLAQVNQARAKRKLGPLHPDSRPQQLMRGALVQVSFTISGRGCPDDLAVVYRVEDEEARAWMNAQAKRKKGLSLIESGPDETEVGDCFVCATCTVRVDSPRPLCATALAGAAFARRDHWLCNDW